VLPLRVDRDIAGSLSFSEEMRQRGRPGTRVIGPGHRPPARRSPRRSGSSSARRCCSWSSSASLPVSRCSSNGRACPRSGSPACCPPTSRPNRSTTSWPSGTDPVVRARELLEPVLLGFGGPAPRGARGRPALLVEASPTTDGSPVEFARSWVRRDQTGTVERLVDRRPPAGESSRSPVGAERGGRSRP
jgi:hypothetical protein